ncbi:hypothetical protein FKM82_005453 [Ascaphus truei]
MRKRNPLSCSDAQNAKLDPWMYFGHYEISDWKEKQRYGMLRRKTRAKLTKSNSENRQNISTLGAKIPVGTQYSRTKN